MRLLIAIFIISIGLQSCISIKRTTAVNNNSGVEKKTRNITVGRKKGSLFGDARLFSRNKYYAANGELLKVERNKIVLMRKGMKTVRSKTIQMKEGEKIRVISMIRGKRSVKEYLPKEDEKEKEETNTEETKPKDNNQ